MLNKMKTFAASAIATLLAATPAPAQVVSYAYDGVYMGGASVMGELSDPTCPGLALSRLEIRDGALRAWDRGRQTVKGLITHDGFFNADFYDVNGAALVFEGTVDRGGAFVGGVFNRHCAYLVRLYKAG